MRISDLVLYNDHHLIACAKPGGVPVQADRTGDPSLLVMAQAYCKRNLYVVHRLDRPCTGLVIFAKTREAAAHLSAQWQARTINKHYLTVVPQGIAPSGGTLTHLLRKSGSKCLVVDDTHTGDVHEATLHYQVIAKLDIYDVLDVTTPTGYFHQIRAQLAAAGYPVRGDVKYGARRGNTARMICLHCAEITFVHPSSLQTQTLSCPLPEEDIWPAVKAHTAARDLSHLYDNETTTDKTH